jgi:hypothetical protein
MPDRPVVIGRNGPPDTLTPSFPLPYILSLASYRMNKEGVMVSATS